MKNFPEANRTKEVEALSRLVGGRLTSVQFILNYLILGFDEKGSLTTLVWPELYFGNRSVRFGAQGYRDDLCSQIEKVVNDSTMETDETIRIDLANGAQIRIPLRSYKASGERAILTGPEHYLFVF